MRVPAYFLSVSLQTYQSRALEPGVPVGGMVDHELGDHLQLSALGFLHETAEVLHGTEIGIDLAILGNVVAVVAARRGVERQQPERGDAEILQIVELVGQAGEVADAVVVAVGEGLDVQLVDDRVLEPQLVAVELGVGPDVGSDVHGRTFTRGSGTAARGPAAGRCASGPRPIRGCAARR